jgi:hypothetical protein
MKIQKSIEHRISENECADSWWLVLASAIFFFIAILHQPSPVLDPLLRLGESTRSDWDAAPITRGRLPYPTSQQMVWQGLHVRNLTEAAFESKADTLWHIGLLLPMEASRLRTQELSHVKAAMAAYCSGEWKQVYRDLHESSSPSRYCSIREISDLNMYEVRMSMKTQR